MTETLSDLTGYSLGALAVFVFFAMSGFFIAASYARSQSALIFLRARTLRLFPCLIVSLLLVACVMGPLVTTLSPSTYFSQPEILTFVVKNITLAWPQYTLPGVFETNPHPAVEGSIWTLIHEVLCYGLVFLAGVLGLILRRYAMTMIFLAYGGIWLLPELMELPIHSRILQTRELSLPFVFGMAFWVWRNQIALNIWGLIGLTLLTYVSAGSVVGFPLLVLVECPH